ncbi:excinuclease ABC subunit UvrC [Helicobacter cetorum]|uniref:UvrABC system protein C n=1 Tax=Helicobacter cetorum (strain ATCC BAA-540 / CCUG 52418 / MIT 99-5656) TaxID=1163745 RepID=I0ET86_HELCM|nr:excinuclease ABC subunit UvrC [Helicobacter cetorum]AFI06155.1 excinuclease ABC subunit C [Helicobacter cetorum MIT 99-5656]
MASLLLSLKNLSSSSGVYQYFDKNHQLLYIGKAKNLKKRVRSYFSIRNGEVMPNIRTSLRIQMMVAQIAFLETILVEHEQDALILENSLIKQLKPKYNVLLRDDKTYPYIYMDFSSDFPIPLITRKVLKQPNIKVFGPFTSGAKDILDSLYELLPLVQKKNCIKAKKACMFYQIERCKAPCENKITKEEYLKIAQRALEMIENKDLLIRELALKMERFSQNLRFEEALVYRDRMAKIQKIAPFTRMDLAKLYDLDIFAFYSENHKAVLVKMFMRKGKIISSAFEKIHSVNGFDTEEVIKQALINHYKAHLPLLPEQILLSACSNEVLIELQVFLNARYSKKITLSIPKKGDKLALVEIAMKNAKEIFNQEKTHNEEQILEEVRSLLNLECMPYRVEIFDTSHHASSQCVGGMVVYENGVFQKKAYRCYHLEGVNEYAQMTELLTRRALKFAKEPPPNLWVVDGGKAQLKIALEVLKSSGSFVEVVAISKEKRDFKAYRSKGGARDIIHTSSRTLTLLPSDKRLQWVQKLRDESHRYAISFHRSTKLKSVKQIALLEEKGIGKASVKKLLDYFGSFEAIEKASEQEKNAVLRKRILRN